MTPVVCADDVVSPVDHRATRPSRVRTPPR